jgi:hypothetical protein
LLIARLVVDGLRIGIDDRIAMVIVVAVVCKATPSDLPQDQEKNEKEKSNAARCNNVEIIRVHHQSIATSSSGNSGLKTAGMALKKKKKREVARKSIPRRQTNLDWLRQNQRS